MDIKGKKYQQNGYVEISRGYVEISRGGYVEISRGYVEISSTKNRKRTEIYTEQKGNTSVGVEDTDASALSGFCATFHVALSY